MLVTLYKIDEVHFRLLGTNGYHVKATRMKDLLVVPKGEWPERGSPKFFSVEPGAPLLRCLEP